ncbi:MAG: c-type cytochrome, partial [Proteobacteria bacterium]|nr:c-type cytochrome [Pseudomonadota bacterium]
ISLMAGWGGAVGLVLAQPAVRSGAPGKVLTFKIGGQATLPSIPEPTLVIDPPPDLASEADITAGLALYNQHCLRCHGLGAVSQGLVPDLRAMSSTTHDIFDAIVSEGVLAPAGMIGFKEVLSTDEVEQIRGYLIRTAHDQKDLEAESATWQRLRNWCLDQLGWLASALL